MFEVFRRAGLVLKFGIRGIIALLMVFSFSEREFFVFCVFLVIITEVLYKILAWIANGYHKREK